MKESSSPWYQGVPNMITLCNLLAGVGAVLLALRGELTWSFTLIIIGACFDFFDGMVARLLKVSGPVGKELDSLADLITFGFAPSAMLYYVMSHLPGIQCACIMQEVRPYLAFLMVAASALRLAKFNVDTRQTTEFIGLPTPANALFWGALLISAPEALLQWTYAQQALLVGAFLACWVLNAEIPMFSLKFHNLSWKDNSIRFLFLIAAVGLIAVFHLPGISYTIVLYVLISIVRNALA